MDNCAFCMKRYICKGMHQFNCEMSKYSYYEPDAEAIERAKKGIEDMERKIKEEEEKEREKIVAEGKSLEEEYIKILRKEKKDRDAKGTHYAIVMKNGEEFYFLERKHDVKFENGWMKVVEGPSLSRVVFAASSDSVSHMFLGDALNG